MKAVRLFYPYMMFRFYNLAKLLENVMKIRYSDPISLRCLRPNSAEAEKNAHFLNLERD